MSRWNFSRTTTQIHWIMASFTCWFTWSKPTFAQCERNDPTNIRLKIFKNLQRCLFQMLPNLLTANFTHVPHPKSDRLPLWEHLPENQLLAYPVAAQKWGTKLTAVLTRYLLVLTKSRTGKFGQDFLLSPNPIQHVQASPNHPGSKLPTSLFKDEPTKPLQSVPLQVF